MESSELIIGKGIIATDNGDIGMGDCEPEKVFSSTVPLPNNFYYIIYTNYGFLGVVSGKKTGRPDKLIVNKDMNFATIFRDMDDIYALSAKYPDRAVTENWQVTELGYRFINREVLQPL